MTDPKLPSEALNLLARLSAAHVEFVLAGELAAAAHGLDWSDPTVVVVPARFARNLDRLAGVLRSLHARRRVAGQPTTVALDVSSAALRTLGRFELTTQRGDLDIDFEPPATAGHLDLFENAKRMRLGAGVEVEVAAVADLVRIAELRMSAADEAMLPRLRAAVVGHG